MNICWITEKATEFQKNIYFCFIDYANAFDCVHHKKLWKILKRDGNTRPPYPSPDIPGCRSRSNIRTRHGTTDWFKIGKGVHQGCILSPSLFNLHAEYIMQNDGRLDEVHYAGLDEAQDVIKIAGRNINNLRYADDILL